MDRKIRTSAIIVTIGLVIALVSLLILHPLSFMAFLTIGVLLMIIGAIYYLIALVKYTGTPPAS